MRRLLLVFALVAATMLAVVPGRTDPYLAYGSPFCDRSQTRGLPITVDGPSSQVLIHAEVFGPAYAAMCRSGSGKVSYLGSGDRSGIVAILDHNASVHFATSDVPLSSVEKMQADFDLYARNGRGRRTQVHQIPLYLGAQVIGYNLPSYCNASVLNLRAQLLGQIFAGRVTKWNDALLQLDNPGLKSCDVSIRLVKRIDYAGATQTFKDYLSKRDPVWNYYKQPEHNQEWPGLNSACPALGERGVADCVRSLRGAVGYMSLPMARLRGLRTARLDNAVSTLDVDSSKRFFNGSVAGCQVVASKTIIAPTVEPVRPIETIELTNGWAATRLDWSALSMTDSPYGYPLCGISFAMIFDRILTAYGGDTYQLGQARTAVDYIWSALSERAQKKLAAYDLGRLPPELLGLARDGVEAVRYGDL